MKTDPKVYKRASQLVQLFYDFQQSRISFEHRVRGPKEQGPEKINLDPRDQAFFDQLDDSMNELEKIALKEANSFLKTHPVYQWLIGQRGISVTLAPVLLGSVDIEKTTTVSKFWRIAGLAVDNRTGRREAPKKGEKLHYNPHLKSRMFLLGECLLKANNVEYRKYYDDYKHRLENRIGPCMYCAGTGIAPKNAKTDATGDAAEPVAEVVEIASAGKAKVCPVCKGAKIAPWGNSAKHRHVASMRYMVKMFIRDLWVRWREYEGLEVRPSYAEQYLGRVHHG